jgi:hypothetical protein
MAKIIDVDVIDAAATALSNILFSSCSASGAQLRPI